MQGLHYYTTIREQRTGNLLYLIITAIMKVEGENNANNIGVQLSDPPDTESPFQNLDKYGRTNEQ